MPRNIFQVHIFYSYTQQWSIDLFKTGKTLKKKKILTTYRDLLCAIWFVFLNFYSSLKFLSFLCYLRFKKKKRVHMNE